MADRDDDENPFLKVLRGDLRHEVVGRDSSGEEWEYDLSEGLRDVLRILFAYEPFMGRFLAGDMEGLPDAMVEDIDSSITRIRENFRRVDEWMRDRAAAAPDGGDPRADWVIAFHRSTLPPELLPDYFSEVEQLKALRRILGRMGGPPIFRKQWNDNVESILAELENLRTDLEDRADAAGWAAGRALTKDLAPAEMAKQEDELLRTLRKTVQRLVFDDVLGPTWRRYREREVDLDARPKTPETIYADPDFASRMIDRDELGYLLNVAGLTDGERDVFELDLLDLDTDEIAKRLDTTPQAIYTRRNAGKNKLEALAREIGP